MSQGPLGHDYIVFGAPEFGQAEIDEVVDSIRAGWVGTGPKTARFEQAFADYKGVSRDCVAAVNSCTAALHLSMLAAGIGRGDEVITTAMTFCATVNAIIHTGATPVLVDIDDATLNIDPEKIEDQISARTRAIVPVHFAGLMCDMQAIRQIAGHHGLKVIEDCAHAIESRSRGGPAGTLGDFGCFSFYATKNVSTAEGGMVIASRAEDAARIRSLALHGLTHDAWHRYSDKGYRTYLVTECGYKYNMTDIQAALGIHQLKDVDRKWQRRRQVWDHYQAALSRDKFILPPSTADPETRHAYHLFPIRAANTRNDRYQIMQRLHQRGIGTGIHYVSIAEHSYYQKTFGWTPGDYEAAKKHGDTTLSIPLSPYLADVQIDRIVEELNSVG